MKIRKFISFMLAGVMLLLSLAGCGSIGTSQNDENTLTINLGIRNVEQLIEGLTNEFPDIHFEIAPTYCVNQSAYLRKTLITGNASDIFYYTQKPDGAEAAEYLLDLSSYDFISNFDRSVINTYLVDGHVYCIPGPVLLRGMAYNKTLFEEHGWSKPESHRELVELCKQIRAETDDITPISMSLGGVGYPFTLVTTLSQAGFLGTPAGEEWEKRFKEGEASVAEGLGEGLEMTAELIDAGAFNVKEYIGVWDDKACNMEFANGKAAMFAMWGGQAALLEMMENNPDYEYAFMPFYGKDEGELTIGSNPGFTCGISKRLGEPGNEKKLENALRVMEWFSTPEAQDLMKAYVLDENGDPLPVSAEMSPLNTEKEDGNSSPYFRELWEQADRGNKMPMIYSGYESIIINGGTIVQDAMLAGSSAGMIEKFIASADADYKDHLSGGDAAVLCEVAQDLSEAETAQLLANGIDEAGLGDFTLITHAGRAGNGVENTSGAGGRYFKGPIMSQDYNIILCNTKNLQALELTGEQVKRLLSDGRRVSGSYDDPGEYADFPYYWAGIDVAMSKDGSVRSVKLDGTELDDAALYKVIFCDGDYTEETGRAGNAVDTGVNLAEYWLDYVTAHKQITPPKVLSQRFSPNVP